MNIGAKSETSAWDQLASTPNHEHPIRPPQPLTATATQQIIKPQQQQLMSINNNQAVGTEVKSTIDAFGEDLHPELV